MSADIPSVGAPRVAASAAAAEQPATAYRWYVLVLVFAIGILNMMDRTIVPALAEPLRAEFHLNDSQFGFLSGLVYAVSFTVCCVPISVLIDRVNRAKLLGCLVAAWGGATMLLGLATSFPVLILTRMGVASAESGGNPTAISILSDYFPPEKRATAIGVFYAANGIAAFLAFALAGWIGATYGWRTAFVCAGAPGIILGLLALLTLREPKRGAFDPPTAQEPTEKPSRPSRTQVARLMVANRTLRLLTIASILSVFGVAGVGAFTASFFFRVHHLPLAQAGFVTGLVMGGAYAAGAIVGGFLSDRLSRRSAGGGCHMIGVATLLAAPCAVGGFLTPSLWVSVVLIFIFKMLVGAFYGATFAGVTHAAPVAVRGAVITFMMLIMNLCGSGGGPQLTGVLSDLFNAAGYADPLKWALATVSSIFLLSGVVFIQAAGSIEASAKLANVTK